MIYGTRSYALEDAAYPTEQDLDFTAGHPPYTYGEYVYGTRTHNMSTDPEFEHEAKMKANWSPMDMLFVSAYTRYVHGVNNEDLEYKYKDDLLDSGVDVTVTPINKLSMTLGYNYLRNNMDSEYYVPYYHG
ncbi:MAG: hypothetical protein C4B57_06240 [Deltaproteobacteria bacterium]|nr:MAG: hypothetical protein C4B57_06240 [Deltaproteobacteria bacterium]